MTPYLDKIGAAHMALVAAIDAAPEVEADQLTQALAIVTRVSQQECHRIRVVRQLERLAREGRHP